MPRGQEWYKWNLSKSEKRFWCAGLTEPQCLIRTPTPNPSP